MFVSNIRLQKDCIVIWLINVKLGHKIVRTSSLHQNVTLLNLMGTMLINVFGIAKLVAVSIKNASNYQYL